MQETVPTTQAPPAEPSARRSLRWTTLAMWAGLLALLALTGWGLLRTTAERPAAGQPAPTFEMQFYDGYGWEGRPLADLADMHGQIVVLNFWASWCVECRLEADMLENSWRKYRDQGVVFLGIAHVDTKPKSLAYLSEFNITYPNAPDLGTAVSRKYEITGVPETFIIDRAGTIAHVQIGPISARALHGIIDGLLGQGG